MSETDAATMISQVQNRSQANIGEIKVNLKNLEGTLSKLSTARNALIDAIVSDAAEAINFWQTQIKLEKEKVTTLLNAFVVAISAQEKTVAALNYITTKVDNERTTLDSGVSQTTFRQWPAKWGMSNRLGNETKDRLAISGNAINVDTTYGTLPVIPPNFNSGSKASPYLDTEVLDWQNATGDGSTTMYATEGFRFRPNSYRKYYNNTNRL